MNLKGATIMCRKCQRVIREKEGVTHVCQIHRCPACSYTCVRTGNLGRHIKAHHPEVPQTGRGKTVGAPSSSVSFFRQCFICKKNFRAPEYLTTHMKNKHGPQGFHVYESAFRNAGVTYRKIYPLDDPIYETSKLFTGDDLKITLQYELIEKKVLKFAVIAKARMYQADAAGNVSREEDMYYRTPHELINLSDFERIQLKLQASEDYIRMRVEDMEDRPGSGWILGGFKLVDLEIVAQPSMRGGAAAKVDIEYLLKNKLTNFRALYPVTVADDEECFYLAVAQSFFAKKLCPSSDTLKEFIDDFIIKLVSC